MFGDRDYHLMFGNPTKNIYMCVCMCVWREREREREMRVTEWLLSRNSIKAVCISFLANAVGKVSCPSPMSN